MNGLLVIDKPGGITSHDVVSRLRRITAEQSIGHLGTLDPMATGVLPLLIGRYTRLAQFFSAAEKTYSGTIRFGFATNTYDAEGVPMDVPEEALSGAASTKSRIEPVLTLAQVRTAAAVFHGEIQQMPPPFSAKKISGTPAYKLARAGKPVELKPATIHISHFEIIALNGSEAAFEMSVSAGGYVRSVAHELGCKLGCGGHLSSLRRTQAGPFTLAHACTLDHLAPLTGDREALEAHCVHPRHMLPDMPSVSADEIALGRLRNGAQANLAEFSATPRVKVFSGQRDLVAIAHRIAGTLFQPIVVLG